MDIGLLGMYVFLAIIALGSLIYSNVENKREQKKQ